MSSASFCRRDFACPNSHARNDAGATPQLVGRMFAAAYEVPPPNPEIDRLCAMLDRHPHR